MTRRTFREEAHLYQKKLSLSWPLHARLHRARRARPGRSIRVPRRIPGRVGCLQKPEPDCEYRSRDIGGGTKEGGAGAAGERLRGHVSRISGKGALFGVQYAGDGV